jgi:hypothetical protein
MRVIAVIHCLKPFHPTQGLFSAAAGRPTGSGVSSCEEELPLLDRCAASGIMPRLPLSEYVRLTARADEVIE